ncbi:MAG: RHS repeat-associated core domain-containing protein [Verrucomicrobia bacterium]|nr:RHS repeat-associated core domain-containing protein [Verrucomicrobiota bacterium]
MPSLFPLHFRLRLLFGLVTSLPAPVAAQIADEATAVPVHFQGMFTADNAAGPDLPAYVEIAALGVSGASALAAGQSTGGIDLLTSEGFARIRPGRTYAFDISTRGLTRLRVKVTPPAGHRVFLNGVEREMLDWPAPGEGLVETHGSFSVRLDDGAAGAVGEASSLRPGRVLWSIGLGQRRNGQPAGSLRLVDDGLTARAFRPDGLYYDRDGTFADGCYAGDDGETLVVKAAGVLRQVYTTSVLADIGRMSAHAYVIRIYPCEQVGPPGPDDTFGVSGLPLYEFLIENPQPPALDAIRITRTTRQNGVLTLWTQMTRDPSPPAGTTRWTVDDWVERPASATTVSSPVRHRWTYSDQDRQEHFEIIDAAGTVAVSTWKRFADISFGRETTRELVEEITGYGGAAPVVTTYTYHTDPARPGNWRKVRTVSANDGSWKAFDYHDDFLTRGQLRQTRRPHRNDPATDPGPDATVGEVVTHTYAHVDAFGTQRLPTRIETRLAGIMVARSDFSYRDEWVVDRSTSYLESDSARLPVRVTERRDFFNAGQSLLTRTWTYREDADPENRYFPGLLRAVERPDRTMTAVVYFAAVPGADGLSYTLLAGGGCRGHATLEGTSDASAGSAVLHYESVTQAMPAPFRAVAGKSTQAIILHNERGAPLLSEKRALVGPTWTVTQQDWTTLAHGLWTSSVRRRSGDRGQPWTVFENNWVAGRLAATLNESGQRQTFEYDSVGRVRSLSRPGATYTEDTVPTLTLLQTHDAAGRVVDTSQSAGGETLRITRLHDTAGRLVRESRPGLGPTLWNYSPTDRTTSVSLPGGGTRIEARLRDGRLAWVGGTAVVEEHYQYDLEPDGRQKVTVRPRSATDVRTTETWSDWLGRPVESRRPGFRHLASAVETLTYDPVTGRLLALSRPGLAPTRYEYNAMGECTRTGLDLGSPGLLPASSDRLTDSDQSFEQLGEDCWLTQRTWIYPTHASAARHLAGVTRHRLTGLSASVRAETRTRDLEDNETVRTVVVDAGAQIVTTATALPGFALPVSDVTLAGFPVRRVEADGLVYRTTYDALGRPSATVDPRVGASSVSYVPHTNLPDERRDPAGTLLSQSTYDAAGRPVFVRDAGGRTTRTEYNLRGQVLRRWGSAGPPVAYVYDDYGQRTHQHTFRDPTGSVPNFWEVPAWPAGPLTPDVTEWEYDGASGLLYRKYSPGPDRKFVEYAYNERGQILSRQWARTRQGLPVTTRYAYFPETGEVRSISYSDGTPAVSFESPAEEAYSRLGQPRFVTDATGRREFRPDASFPWRPGVEHLPSFYGQRVLAPLFEAATSAQAGTAGYVGHTLGTVKGRAAGFRLGPTSAEVSTAELELSLATANTGRLAGLLARRAGGSIGRQFVYAYEPIAGGLTSPLIQGLSVVGHPYQVSRTYEPRQDRLSRLDTLWSGAVRTRFDYRSTSVGQRESVVQSGDVFADLGPTHQRFTYTPRGEIASAYGYAGEIHDSTDAPLPARLHDYTYDAAGNRLSANTSGRPTIQDRFLANELNQYRQRENNTLPVSGTLTAAPAAWVAVSGPPPLPSSGGQGLAGRVGTYWGTTLVVGNQQGPFSGPITIQAVLPGGAGGGMDVTRQESRNGFLAPAVQVFSYDADGNLQSDGLWEYSWDAENRLSSMTTSAAAVAAGRPALILSFLYDYQHRRVRKEVRSSATAAVLRERRFLYEGWNVVAELDGAATLKRTFVWGLDLNGGRGTAGGVGGLLQIEDLDAGKTLLPAFDGNGNVAALLNAASGNLEAAYEYDPFGELLRATGPYASANPLRFSTKWHDEESGLCYFGYRYYSPREGRFLSRDPIEERGGLNLYGFCDNDPINHWDYLGQKSWLSRLWNRFRHTVISAALYAIPVAGPTLSTLYNVGVGARYGGVQGAALSLAASGRLGGALAVASQAHGLYRTFQHGKFLNNFGNWFLGSTLANASYQVANYLINGPPSFPAPIDLSGEKAIDPRDLGERIGTFESREELNEFLSHNKGLDPYGSDFFTAVRDGSGWDLHKSNGIQTDVVFANGIQGLLGRHTSLGASHLLTRFTNLTQFTIAHNRSHGFLLDILEAGGDLLGIPSKSSLKLLAGLQTRLERGHAVHLVAHSQGFATMINALRWLGLRQVDASRLTLYPHAGAGNSFHAAALATAVDARLMPHVFSSFDLVPGIAGMNGNPLQVATGLLGFPSLFRVEAKSPHSIPNANSELPWRRWGPGN